MVLGVFLWPTEEMPDALTSRGAIPVTRERGVGHCHGIGPPLSREPPVRLHGGVARKGNLWSRLRHEGV